MVAKLKPDVFVNTNPFLEAMNKERLNHKGYCDKIAVSINNKKYNVNSKDIENILNGKGDLFKKRTLWEFVRDLFPGSHIKEVKGLIYEFVTKVDNKAEVFDKIKSLAKIEQQWRFSTKTDFTTNENNEVIVSRSFNLYTGATPNDDEKKQVSSERLTLDNYLYDSHFDNSPLKRLTFDDYSVKLKTLIKNRIPIINTTINLSSLSKDVLNSLKYCSFKNVIFSGDIKSVDLNGPVFENCYFEDCKFKNIQLYEPVNNTVGSENNKPIIGMFKGCFISKCEIENYRCETSKVYNVTQPVSINEKLGSYLFMQSFVHDCIIQGGYCPDSSILLSHFYNCNIAGLDAHRMDFLANSFNKSNYDDTREQDTGTVFYNCNLNHVKINSGLSEDGSDKYMFNPDEYFSDYIERRSRNLRLDDNFSKCIDNIKKGINSSFSKNNTENNNVFFKNSNLIGASLGCYYSGDRCKDCAIDPNTNYSINGLTARKYTYMDLDGAISKEQIPDFLKKVSAINIDIINFYNSESKANKKYRNAFLELELFLSTLYGENKSYEGKYHFDNSRLDFFIFKDMQENAQNIINNMIESDRIKFVESIINKMILPPDGTILTENLKEYVQKQIKASHKESATNVIFDYKELASIFGGIEEKQIEALSNQLEHIKSFKTDYDSRLNKFARDFQYLSSAFAINRQDLLKNYQEIKASIKDYDDLLREIKDLTIRRDKSVDDKRTLFDNKRDNWNTKEVQDEVEALNKKIADCDNEIRSKLTIVRNNRLENQYKDDKNISDAMRNILDWFERYPDIVKNITQA
ncbi:T3SS effector EspY4 [Escherichia albertii]|uniref:T3SS effector EspY4 n=1 Tax=Escherichia albertii TaxID=208962 RepID=UPI00072188AA|nr:T3SS effector EspY4 [Escherichia albertii]EFB5188267.1 type III effector [Escherichia albertii]MCU7277598.1 type III effector [Escherichia albertii]MCZ8758659.1 type III effector [Escherichia albertii]MCZ9088455.1 type III effector [Escherichia albertii]MDD9763224.1 T3SS effector EspY4 [Escherichia albertii]